MSVTTARRDLPWEAVPLALLIAGDAAWLYPWSLAIASWIDRPGASPLLDLPMIAGLLVGALLATRIAFAHTRSLRLVQTLLIALGLGLALALGRTDLALPGGLMATSVQEEWPGPRAIGVIGLTIVVWWRGIGSGRGRPSLASVEASARWSILALVVLILVHATSPAQTPLSAGLLLTAVVVVVTTALIGLPLARVSDVGTARRPHAAQPFQLSRSWLAMLVSTVAVLVLGGLILTSLFAFDQIATALRPLGELLLNALVLIVTIIALPIGLLVSLLIDLLRQLLGPTVGELALGNAANRIEPLPRPAAEGEPPELLMLLITGAGILVVLALVVWWLSRVITRPTDSRDEDEVEEVRDYVWSWEALWASLIGQFRQLIRRGREATAIGGHSRWRQYQRRGPEDPREVYRELLRIGAALGRRRSPDETPFEYERALENVPTLSDDPDAIRALTQAYVEARYGAPPPPEGLFGRAIAALDQLRARLTDDRPSDGAAGTAVR